MTELHKRLLDLGYKFCNYSINKVSFFKHYDCFSLVIDTDVYIIFISRGYVNNGVIFCNQEFIDDLQKCFNILQNDLNELKNYVKKN